MNRRVVRIGESNGDTMFVLLCLLYDFLMFSSSQSYIRTSTSLI